MTVQRFGPGWQPPAGEVEFSAVRAQGPGGQNVHKVSSAAHLRYDIRASTRRRLEGKAQRAEVKAGRGRVRDG